MARICRMTDETVRACLQELQARNMLTITERPGKTNIYVLTAPSKWVSNTDPSETTVGVNNGGTPPPNNGGRRISTKGNPDKGKRAKSQRVTPWEQLPESLNTATFRDIWSRYEEYRKAMKLKPLLDQSILLKWKGFAEWGHDAAVKAIQDAMSNGYQGIPKPKASDMRGKQNHEPQQPSDFGGGF